MIDYITKSGFNNNLGSIHTPLFGVSFLLDREDLGFSFHASAVRVNKFPHAPWNRLVRSRFLHGVLPSPFQVIFLTLIPKSERSNKQDSMEENHPLQIQAFQQ